MRKCLVVFFCAFSLYAFGQQVKLAVLKYQGGDWYASPSALSNLIAFTNLHLKTNIEGVYDVVEASSADIFNYPFLFMTGHGRVFWDGQEVENLRSYFEAGGFLHIDDNYGLFQYVVEELKKVFPNQEPQELPFSHPLFQKPFIFQDGLPKVHEHDKKRPQAFGYFINGRLTCLLTYESDLVGGWEDEEVYNDPQPLRLKAQRMGTNILHYVFTHP